MTIAVRVAREEALRQARADRHHGFRGCTTIGRRSR